MNPFRRLARRTLFGAGGRWDFVRADAWDGSLGASYMLELERLTDDPTGGTETEHRASYFLTVIGQATETLRLDVSAFFQPLLDDHTDSRAYATASGRVDVAGGLDLLVALGLLHDSEPPEGVEPTISRSARGSCSSSRDDSGTRSGGRARDVASRERGSVEAEAGSASGQRRERNDCFSVEGRGRIVVHRRARRSAPPGRP